MTQKLIKQLILNCIIFFISFVNAQTKLIDQGLTTIKINLDTGTVIKEFPFDEYINIEITSKKNALIDSIALFEVVYVKGEKVLNDKDLKRNIRRIKRSKKPIPLKKSPEITYVKIKADDLVPYVYKGVLNPLSPDKVYQFIVVKKLNKIQLNTIYEILRLLKNQNFSKTKEVFDKKIKSLDDNSFQTVRPEIMYSFDYLKDTLASKIEIIYSDLTKFKNQPNKIDADDIEKFITMLGAKKISNVEFSQTMYGYTEIGGETNSEVFQGFRAIGSDSIIDTADYGLRRENIKNSYKKLNKLDEQFRNLIAHHASDSNVAMFYKNVILKMKHNLKYNDSLITEVSKKANDLINKYYSFGGVVTNATFGKQDGKNGLAYLVPDIGFVNAWGKDQANKIEYIGRPYFGLNWHITGYNRDKKVSQLPQKRFWTRFSLSLGVTLGEIDEGGYKDLFEGVSPSVGLNVRLAKNVRLGIGGLILRYNRNPIVNKENPAVLPYVSISFDNKFFKEFAIFNRIFK